MGGAPSDWFVDDDAAPGGDGLTWQTAIGDLQVALNLAASSGGVTTEIRVAQGTYRPSARTVANDPRSATFQLLNGVSVKGGFAGTTSATPDERDIELYRTILSGDLAGDDGPEYFHNEENAYHVVTGSGTAATAVLEGFTITAGNAFPVEFSNGPAFSGAGLYNDHGGPTILDCTFKENALRGFGAVFNKGGTLLLQRCRILSNGSWDDYNVCGGLGNRESARTVLIDCIISGNLGGHGSAFWNDQASSLALINCVVAGNFSYDTAVYNTNNSNLILANCLVAANYNILILPWTTPRPAGISGYGGSTRITNCIIWGNRNPAGTTEAAQIELHPEAGSVEVNYNCIEGWSGTLAGVGNSGLDPLFVDLDGPDNLVGTADDNFHQKSGSPCIDSGDNLVDTDMDLPGVQSLPATDLDGGPRFLDDPTVVDTGQGAPPIVDMGPYEGPKPSFELSATTLQIGEDSSAVFQVWLRDPPGSVLHAEVRREDGDARVVVASGEAMTFDDTNYAVPQEVVLKASKNDGFSNGRATIRISAAGIAPSDIFVAVHDIDPIPRIVFVNQAATDTETGLSWKEGFHDLESALTVVRERTGTEEIWVAAGTYRPTRRTIPLDPRSATFQMLDGVRIYGGFNGTESHLSERNYTENVTTLNGDRLGNDLGDLYDASRDDNSYHVVTASGVSFVAQLDGFRITGGHATKTDPQENGQTGGGVFNEGGSPSISNCTITRNRATWSAAAIKNIDASDVWLRACEISHNEAGPDGRRGAIESENSGLFLSGCTLKENSVIGYTSLAGAITHWGGELTISHCAFNNNKALPSSENTAYAMAGAVFCNESIVTIEDSTFDLNYADNYGAVAVSGAESVNITACDFRDNGAIGDYGDAGALLIDGCLHSVVAKCRFISNKCEDWGGAGYITNYFGSIKVFDCLFDGNQAGPGSFGSNGGGLYLRGSSNPVEISRCQFVNNKAFGGSGGGLYVVGDKVGGMQAKPEVLDCFFSGNNAGNGGGLDAWNAAIRSCEFFQNRAVRGGAMHITGSTVADSVISGNRVTSTSGRGGGVFATSGRIWNCMVSGNTSSTSGGGIALAADAWEPRTDVINCTVTGNTAASFGAGLSIGSGGARLQDCILWNNARAGDTSMKAQISGGPPSIHYSCIQGWDGSLGGVGNFGADPLFVSPAGLDGIPGTEDDDLHLSSASPCANAGGGDSSLAPTTDFEGEQRIQGCRIDIGADESPHVSMLDCNLNGVTDDCDIADGSFSDCNENHVPDACDIATSSSVDSNSDGVPDECEAIRLFVSQGAAGADDGASWSDAFRDLQPAMKVASERPGPTEVWVAAGIYTPAPPRDGDRAATFRLLYNLSLYGGFAGTELSLDQRDPVAHETILSGDLNGDDGPEFTNTDDNSNHVITAIDVDASAILDGFVISHGWARSPLPRGAGVRIENASPRILNCTIRENTADYGGGVSMKEGKPIFSGCAIVGNQAWYGGGLYLGVNADATLQRCAIQQNHSNSLGGGIYADMRSAAMFSHSKISRNVAASDYGSAGGGGVFASIAKLEFRDTEITGNYSPAGGAVYGQWDGSLSFTNCTVCDNLATDWCGGIVCEFPNLSVVNCILWGNESPLGTSEWSQISPYDLESLRLEFSCIQGRSEIQGNGVMGLNPRFTRPGYWEDPTNPSTFQEGDYHLRRASPCINSGDPAFAPPPDAVDIDGDPRVLGGRVEMGADEFSGLSPAETRGSDQAGRPAK